MTEHGTTYSIHDWDDETGVTDMPLVEGESDSHDEGVKTVEWFASEMSSDTGRKYAIVWTHDKVRIPGSDTVSFAYITWYDGLVEYAEVATFIDN